MADDAVRRTIRTATLKGDADAIVAALWEAAMLSPAAAARGCAAVGTVASLAPAACDRVVEAGGVRALTCAIRGHPSSTAVARRGVAALQLIAVTRPGDVASGGGVGAAAAALAAFPADYPLAIRCVWLLCPLTNRSGHWQSVIDAGGLEAVARALPLHARRSADFAQAGSAMLSNCMLSSRKAPQRVAAAGGVAALAAAIRAQRRFDVGYAVCCGIANMIDNGCPQLVASALDGGGVAAVVSALAAEVDEGNLASSACAALHAMARHSAAAARAVVDGGGMEAAMKAIAAHHSCCRQVGLRGCDALASMVQWGYPPALTALVRAGALADVALVVRSCFLPQPQLIKAALVLLQAAAAHSEASAQAVVDGSGVVALLERCIRMRNWLLPVSADVAMPVGGVKALLALLAWGRPAIAKALTSGTMVDAVLGVLEMQTVRATAGLCAEACDALVRLMSRGAAPTAAMSARAAELVRQAQQAHVGDARLAALTGRALRLLGSAGGGASGEGGPSLRGQTPMGRGGGPVRPAAAAPVAGGGGGGGLLLSQWR